MTSDSRTVFFVDGMAISLALFSASAIYFVKRMIPTQHPSDLVPFYQRRHKSLQDLLLQEQHSSLEDNDSGSPPKKRSISDSLLSKRGQASLIPVIPIQQQFLSCIRVRGMQPAFVKEQCEVSHFLLSFFLRSYRNLTIPCTIQPAI
jgi:hypothetical protein